MDHITCVTGVKWEVMGSEKTRETCFAPTMQAMDQVDQSFLITAHKHPFELACCQTSDAKLTVICGSLLVFNLQ